MAVETSSKPLKEPQKKFDPFHPEMPQIPGLSDAHLHTFQRSIWSRSAADPGRFTQIGGVAIAALLICVAIFWWAKSVPRHVIEPQSTETTIPAFETAPPPSAPVALPPAADQPVQAATAEDLAKPWSAKKFVFVRPITRENVDAMVIRLPGGGLWAFALQEPYGRCELEYVTDVALLAKKYQYRASHPMVANPCNSTIYDPLKLGSLGGNVWTRGEIVQGEGLRPPISIDVKTSGHSIIADRIE